MIAKLMSLLGWKKKPDLKTVFLGGGHYVVQVPSHWQSEEDPDDGSVTVSLEGCEDVYLRFNVLGFAPKDDSVAPATGYSIIAESGKPNLEVREDRAISMEQSIAEQDGESWVCQNWATGFQAPCLVLLSVMILERARDRAPVKEVLAFLPDLLDSIFPAQEERAVETLHGQVEYTSTQVESFPQENRPLQGAERQWIREQEAAGRKVASRYASVFENTTITTDLLDEVFAAWSSDSSPERPDADRVAEGLGVLFGQNLVSSLGMEWVKVEDAQGSDFGVRLVGYELISFPIAAVHKRIASGEVGFFTNVHEVIRSMIDNKEEYKQG